MHRVPAGVDPSAQAVAFPRRTDYLHAMIGLTPLDICLAQALHGILPVPADVLAPDAACGHVLAGDVALPQDMPPAAEALRAGLAVAALDLVGANAGAPVPLGAPARVVPGAPLPPGTDAVLPEDGSEAMAGHVEAIRSVAPGEGVRRAGHDGRGGETVLRAGRRLGPPQRLLAELAGVAQLAVRRPRVRVALADPRQAAFAAAFLEGLGALPAEAEAPHLTLLPTTDHVPRLALAPAETGWLAQERSVLVLTVPTRFDGMVAACLGLALPAMAALTGARPRTRTRPIARKLTSTVGLSELVLLAEDAGAWVAQPAGTVTLTGLAAARAFAILPPDSEGLPAAAPLTALPLDQPFG